MTCTFHLFFWYDEGIRESDERPKGFDDILHRIGAKAEDVYVFKYKRLFGRSKSLIVLVSIVIRDSVPGER